MPVTNANERFLTSTRGQILLLLRRASVTVDELAQALQLTDNAIRSHLVTLERDGLIRQNGERRRGGKPAALYTLTPQATQLFPHSYDFLLSSLLDVLAENMTDQQREALLRTVGRRLAVQWPVAGGDMQRRLAQAIEALNHLGGLAELEEGVDGATIQGYSCPFAAVVSNHPEICQLAETFLTELVGAPVQQKCDTIGSPRCSFVVLTPGAETTT